MSDEKDWRRIYYFNAGAIQCRECLYVSLHVGQPQFTVGQPVIMKYRPTHNEWCSHFDETDTFVISGDQLP